MMDSIKRPNVVSINILPISADNFRVKFESISFILKNLMNEK